jgi:TatA/E family protein of Tat protein translocase
MFGVESKELLIILFAVLILFGPRRIPEVARALGKGLGDVRDALSGIERDVRHAADSLALPETRPIPGVGALPTATPGGPVAGRALEGGRAPEGDRAPSGDRAPGGDRARHGECAFPGADRVTGSVDAPTVLTGATPTEGASGGSVATDPGGMTAQKPEPGPGPGLAG